jgi:predicted nucleic acid-binding protein
VRYLDANVILRYLTGDDPAKAQACFSLFQRVAAGDEEMVTSSVIVHEVLYVLTSRAQYGLSHQDAAARLRPILAMRGLKLTNKRVYARALDVYAGYPHLDFGDALAVAESEHLGIREIVSYDSDYDSVPGVTRAEP